ncbi:MAG TPA: hypothetical protein VGF44_17470 [Terriglobales bacterium]
MTRMHRAIKPANAAMKAQHANANPAEQRAAFQEHRASNWKSQHRDWQQRGGYHGYLSR